MAEAKEAELKEIPVTEREYEAELRLVKYLEERYRELEREWEERTKGLVVVTKEEYERQAREIEEVARELKAAWSAWSYHMRMRRRALREGREEEAALHLEEIRRWFRRARELRRRLEEMREEHARKAVITPELALLKRRLEATWRRLVEAREKLARKVVVRNKIIAMHKRWFYESPRGKHHDISIEAIASIIVPLEEPTELYLEVLRDALEDYVYSARGFERLTELKEEVVGVQEKPTALPTRDVEVHMVEWWHEVFKEPQLKLTDFVPELR
ncbi:MAG: hypothetical protein QXU64_04455 [Thermofilaceae archaeon]